MYYTSLICFPPINLMVLTISDETKKSKDKTLIINLLPA